MPPRDISASEAPDATFVVAPVAAWYDFVTAAESSGPNAVAAATGTLPAVATLCDATLPPLRILSLRDTTAATGELSDHNLFLVVLIAALAGVAVALLLAALHVACYGRREQGFVRLEDPAEAKRHARHGRPVEAHGGDPTAAADDSEMEDAANLPAADARRLPKPDENNRCDDRAPLHRPGAAAAPQGEIEDLYGDVTLGAARPAGVPVTAAAEKISLADGADDDALWEIANAVHPSAQASRETSLAPAHDV